jgi:uncharacterized membrane protein YhdT
MIKPNSHSSNSPTARHLHNVVLIRTFVLIGLAVSITLSYWWSVSLAYSPLLLILLSLGIVNLLTHWRSNNELPVTDIELFIQLLIDCLFCFISAAVPTTRSYFIFWYQFAYLPQHFRGLIPGLSPHFASPATLAYSFSMFRFRCSPRHRNIVTTMI